MKPYAVLTMGVLAGTALACGGSLPPPNDQWAAAQADVGRAQSADGASDPNARLHLQLAQEDLQQAHRLMGDDNGRATSLTELARAEAQLSFSLARAAAAQESARRAVTELQKQENR